MGDGCTQSWRASLILASTFGSERRSWRLTVRFPRVHRSPPKPGRCACPTELAMLCVQSSGDANRDAEEASASCFNPLPGPEPRETGQGRAAGRRGTGFNPLPGPEPRETRRDRETTRTHGCFNPLPGPEPRETGAEPDGSSSPPRFQFAPGTGAPGDVCAPARRVGQYRGGFNSLPGPEPRETDLPRCAVPVRPVSIRSRDRSPGRLPRTS